MCGLTHATSNRRPVRDLPAHHAAVNGAVERRRTFRREQVEAFRGRCTVGSGASWFRRCGSAPADSAWWVTAIRMAVAQLDSARVSGRLLHSRPSYVEWRAVPTQGGELGPRGKGATALPVCSVQAVRPSSTSDGGAR